VNGRADRSGGEEGFESRFFHVVLVLKGLDGLLEVVGGVLLFFATPARIAAVAGFLTQHELSEDPHDLVAHSILVGSQHLTHGSATIFGALYLLSHGLIKLVLVWAVLRDRLWAYPWMIAFLAVFIVYQSYRMTVEFTVGLLLLTLFDILITWLTVRDYRRHRRRAGADEREVGAGAPA
jgi:uncharacterized membrane protein